MGVNVHDVPCGIVEVLVLTETAVIRVARAVKVPVHREVDDAGAVELAVVGCVIGHAFEECVIGGGSA